MNLLDAFILASAVSYLACTFYCVLDRPAIDNVSKENQGVGYFAAFGVIILSLRFSVLNLPLGFLYCFAAVGSFLGWPQKWMSYWMQDPKKGSGAQQVGMAAWDLLLAIAFFMKSP